MDFQDLSVKEVNSYYACRGGIRTAAITGYANVGSFPALMQRVAAQARQAAQAAAQTGEASQTQAAAQTRKASQAGGTAQAGKAPQSHNAVQTGKTTRTNGASQTNTSSEASASAQALSDNGNICCDKCQAVSQVVLQMMSKNLYAQSALGYPLTAMSSWTAYQNMANILGNNLF